MVAPLSNAFSALCGALTVALLYSTLRMLGTKRFGALVGALCYLFCDTAWFSAVESEVYAPAMLFCALDVWVALRWRHTGNARLLPLLGLLLGLGTGVHLMTLLVVPALALIVLGEAWEARKARDSRLSRSSRLSRISRIILVSGVFFVVGLTAYAIIPIRAAAHPPINENNPSTTERFIKYLKREQYAKAPLYPRMWRERDSANWEEWTLGTKGVVGNAVYYFGYQLNYMYFRYLMYNFIGRENRHWGIIIPFVLPCLLGVWGLWRHWRRSRRDWWTVMLLFLFGGIILNLYLNHPCYEPRARDYVYVLSFYAFALWIGIGADSLPQRRWLRVLALLAPLTLAIGNWSDHDRSRCHSVHDIALNHLNSCDRDAVLITLGDNDTFPLWYLQQVEGLRTDIEVHNIGLTGWQRTMDIINSNLGRRPVYFSHYFWQRHAALFPLPMRCEGFCWHLLPYGGDTTPIIHEGIEWHITQGEYIDPVSRQLLGYWNQNMMK